MKLYIIGNGFDLNHGMRTSYWDYRDFLIRKYFYIIKEYEGSQYLEAYNCSRDTRWSDLESCLRIEFEECMSDIAGNFYPDMTSERTPGWDDISIEVSNTFSFLSAFTQDCFYEWINEVTTPDEIIKRQDIDKAACFVTFNYTRTLEEIYHIPDKNILHIHGDISDFRTIQFGTPENHPDVVYSSLENIYSEDEFYNVTFAPAISSISSYANNAYKGLKDNYVRLRNFLNNIGQINEIVIMGHSYLGIDEPYYSDVLVPMLSGSMWTIHVHDQEDIKQANQFISWHRLLNAQLVEW